MSNLITKDFIAGQLDFWGSLGTETQKTITTETVGVVAEINRGVAAKLGVGRHLTVIKKELADPRVGVGRWMKYCNNLLPFTYRTAERYIEAFSRVEGILAPPLLEAAVARGVDLVAANADPDRPFGRYTEAVKELPPPKEPSAAEAAAWVEKVKKSLQDAPPGRSKARRRVDPVKTEVRVFRSVLAAYKTLPAGKGRTSWAAHLIGKLLTEMAIGPVKPEPVPAGYRAVVGRPKMIRK